MSHPREILGRARRQRARSDIPDAPRTPAPAPIAPAPAQSIAPGGPGSKVAPMQSAAPVGPVAQVAQVAAVAQVAPVAQVASVSPTPAPRPAQGLPRPAGGHALYSELMRSHDRMGTRHLKG